MAGGYASGFPLAFEVGFYVGDVCYAVRCFLIEGEVGQDAFPVVEIWLVVCRQVQYAAWLEDASYFAEEGCADEATRLALVLGPWVWE